MTAGPPGLVLDTNVLVSAALGDGPARRLVVTLASRRLLVTSRVILDELAEVLDRAPVRERLKPRTAARFPSFVERHAHLVEPSPVNWPENLRDAHVIGTALAAGAVLVTGDKGVLEGCAQFGVRGMTVREALAETEA